MERKTFQEVLCQLQVFQEVVDREEMAMILQSINYEVALIEDQPNWSREEREKEKVLMVEELLGHLGNYHVVRKTEGDALANVFESLSV